MCVSYDRAVHQAAHLNQEDNDMSGSRGEANFVWRCKNCKVPNMTIRAPHLGFMAV